MLRRTVLPAALAAAALCVTALPLAGSAAAAPAAAARPASVTPAVGAALLASPLTRQLAAATAGSARLSVSQATGALRFLGTAPGHPVPAPAGLAGPASAEAAARSFLRTYGSLFGVAESELALTRSLAAPAGATTLRFQQLHRGLPVVAGELVVDVDAAGATLSATGEASPGLTVGSTPAVNAATAQANAVTAITKWRTAAPGALTASAPVLSVYDPALVGADGPQVRGLVWDTEVTNADRSVREMVLVDAGKGSVVLHVDRDPEAKTRYVCNVKNVVKASDACTGTYARVEGGAPTGIKDVDLAYDYAGITYDFYKGLFGRDGLDGKGLPMRSTVKYCPDEVNCPFQNAYWNGTQMVYGDGYASGDDVVGHELTHAVTEYSNGLFYYMQSGAINESMSDVMGELIDLTDGRGKDTAADRWKIGEDLPIGAIRDMMHPEDFSDPDRISSLDYDTGTGDSGGVHKNSGVGNKAAALIVDGGTFNGRTITGIGTTKAARVYYAAEQHLTEASDYNDLYDVLQQACTSQVGTNGITSANCANVTKAVQATEMNKQPFGAEVPEAPVCATGQTRRDLFSDDLENPASGNWAKARTSTVSSYFGWAYPQDKNGYAPGAVDVDYAHSGKTLMWGDDYGDAADDPDGTDKSGSSTMTRTRTVPVAAGTKTYLRFAHASGFEADAPFFSDPTYYDGGRVEYSTDGGTTWKDAGALPSVNGYNAPAVEAFGGKPGFGGVSHGYTSSRFDLSSLAGKNVKVRFAVANDQFVGDYGWFVDDIALYSCS